MRRVVRRIAMGAAVAASLCVVSPWVALATLAAPAPEDGVCALREPGFERSQPSGRACATCHDDVAEHEGHPVGVAYEEARAANPAAWLRAPEALPPEVVLVDGELTCTSCHDGEEPASLALPMSGSALCFACHDY